jgi:hypothetical protein
MPTIPRDVVANPILRHLLAGAPRVICDSCGKMFLLASVAFRAKFGKPSVCPACETAGSMRDATDEEVARVVPASTAWSRSAAYILAVLALVGAGFLAYVFVVIR